MKNWLVTSCGLVAALVLGCAATGRADFVYYSDRASFDAANPGTALEDFEEATTNLVVNGPQDKFTDNDAFNPGDILPNLQITAVGALPDEFFVNEGNYGPTKVLTTNYGDNFARIDFFELPIGVFGVDLSGVNSGDPYTIRIFGSAGLLDTQTVSATSFPSSFFGFLSTDGVTRVEIDSPVFETFDNISILAIRPVPEPSSLTLIGVGILGMVGYVRSRKSGAASRA